MKRPKMTRKRMLGASNSQTGEFLSLPYAGTWIKVQVVDGVGGAYKPGYASEEIIGRTASGGYFLAREISLDWLEPRPPAFALPGEGFWLRVKRLSFRAATLYITRSTASAFRVDLLRAMFTGSEQKEAA